MMIYRLFLILITIFVLSACGGAATQRTLAIEPLVSRQSTAHRDPDAAAPPPPRMSVPTLVPTAPPTPTSTLAPTAAGAALPELTQRGYATLVLLRGLTARIQDLAQQASTVDSEGQNAGAGLAQRLAVAGILKVIEGSLAQDPPDPALAGAWDTARATTPQLKDVLDRWMDGQLPARDVGARLAPIQAELDQLLATANQRLGSSYGVDADRLGSVASDALARLRAAVQPTPAD